MISIIPVGKLLILKINSVVRYEYLPTFYDNIQNISYEKIKKNSGCRKKYKKL